MPADHASGRFGLGLNELSRKVFPLAAALSLVISTAAHADRCVPLLDSDGMPVQLSAHAPRSCGTPLRTGVHGEPQASAVQSVCRHDADMPATVEVLARAIRSPAQYATTR